MVLYVYLLRLG
ncbi:UNVERIFIED_CONTAM: hypothetical protein GTU68_051978 [Idotea baltica]|nr:hypothetical protein [Idotea baltica]